MSKNKKTNVK